MCPSPFVLKFVWILSEQNVPNYVLIFTSQCAIYNLRNFFLVCHLDWCALQCTIHEIVITHWHVLIITLMCSLLNHIKVSIPFLLQYILHFLPDQDKINDDLIFTSQCHSSVYCLQILCLFLKFHLDWCALQCAFHKHGI